MPDEWLEPAGGPKQWRDFNKYKDGRRVAWICNYVDLLDNDDYLELTGHQRSVLHGFWLTFASSRAHVALNTTSLSARLGLRVTRRDIDALIQAGFLRVSVTKPLRGSYGFVTYRDAREGGVGKGEEDLSYNGQTNNPVQGWWQRTGVHVPDNQQAEYLARDLGLTEAQAEHELEQLRQEAAA